MKFCLACGARLARRRVGGTIRDLCPRCGRVAWRNPIPGARAFVERGRKLLLVRDARGWDTPGGLLEEDEGPRECLAREAREETGLLVRPTALVGVYNHAAGDRRVLNLYFRARPNGGKLRDGASWFDARDLPPLAYPRDNARAFAERSGPPLTRVVPAWRSRSRPDESFCGSCGAELVRAVMEGRARRVCPRCGWIAYRNPKPCAGAVVERGGKVLLVRRSVAPYRGRWDIPGGFLEEEEHPEEAAKREVREETGLAVRLGSLLGVWMDRYEGRSVLNFYYRAAPSRGRLRPGDDAADLDWFGPDELPRRIAYPGHAPAVLAARRAAVLRG